MSQVSAIDSLSIEQVGAIAAIWQGDGRRLSTRFSGVSMLPAIAPGQAVVLNCGVKPGIGDVVVCMVSKQLRVHRVVAYSGTWLMTWGDANPLPDVPVDIKHAIGVIEQVPSVRRPWHQTLLLSLLLYRCGARDNLARRVSRLYGARRAWAKGPVHFAGKALAATFKR